MKCLLPSLSFAFVAMVSTVALADDFDYSDNRGFLRRYPDFACIDTGPLSQQEAESYTGAKLQALGRQATVPYTRPHCFSADGPDGGGPVTETVTGSEFLDRLYARLPSGPIPHGFFDGRVVLSRDRGIKSIAELGIWVPKEKTVEGIAERIWAGKFFDRDRLFLKNRVNLDGIDWHAAPTSITDKRMKFPAKLYCGQSLFDSRRESIVIDYMYGVEDRPDGVDYDKAIDWVAGPKGFQIRDEIRMVKPGLYLGRAYLKQSFGLYFILEYHSGTGTEPSWSDKDSCWLGHQRQKQLGMRPSDYINGAN